MRRERCRHSQSPGGQASDDSGLRRMCRHDVGSQFGQCSPQVANGAEIVDRIDRAAHRVDTGVGYVQCLETVQEGTLPSRDDRDLVTVLS